MSKAMTEEEAKAAGEALALVEYSGKTPTTWTHVYWRDEDGETDPDGGTRYWPAGWTCFDSDEYLPDLDAKIVTFAPLPEVSHG